MKIRRIANKAALSNEADALALSNRDGLVKLKIINALYGIGINKNKNFSKKIKETLVAEKMQVTPLSISKLLAEYQNISRRLNKKYPLATIRTQNEIKFIDSLKASTNMTVRPSVWIGSHNVDILIEKIKSTSKNSMRGLVIEIDGGVHNNELKMKKDNLKSDYLFNLKIGCSSILNSDLNDATVTILAAKIKNLPRLDSRALSRLRRDIYLATIAANTSTKYLSQLFGINFNQLIKIAKEHKNEK